jgi:hypothetical protein
LLSSTSTSSCQSRTPDLSIALRSTRRACSTAKRNRGVSLNDAEPWGFSLDDHVETWCQAVDAILPHVDDPDAYFCEFGRLRRDGTEESRRIARFLGIPEYPLFGPREAGVPGFRKEEREEIPEVSRERLDTLASYGLSDLG